MFFFFLYLFTNVIFCCLGERTHSWAERLGSGNKKHGRENRPEKQRVHSQLRRQVSGCTRVRSVEKRREPAHTHHQSYYSEQSHPADQPLETVGNHEPILNYLKKNRPAQVTT